MEMHLCLCFFLFLSALLPQPSVVAAEENPTPPPSSWSSSSATFVLGAGASLPARLYRIMTYTYQFVAPDTDVQYVSTGSGLGIRLIKKEVRLVLDNANGEFVVSSSSSPTKGQAVDFAGSDAHLSEQDYIDNPNLQMYPSTATAVVPIYRLDALSENYPDYPAVILSRQALARIFAGNITMWNDPLIQQDNPEVIMPDQTIKVVVRRDSSGTTEIFTKALSLFSDEFQAQVGVSKQPQAWIQDASIDKAPRNDGVVAAVLSQDASISYAVLSDAMDRELDYARMVNRAGHVVTASAAAVEAALAELAGLLLDNTRLTADIQDASSSTAWPIAGLTYFVLDKTQHAHACETRIATLDFLQWYYTSQSAARVQQDLGFARLPENMRKVILDRMFDEVLCSNGDQAKQDERVVQVEIPVPAIVEPLFATFGAAYAEIAPNVFIDPIGYEPNSEVPDDLPARVYESNVYDGVDAWVSPLFVAGVAILYRLDGTDSANRIFLSPFVLDQIFRGEITMWDDVRIRQDNRGESSRTFPATPIRVIYRSDDSRTTWVFTSALHKTGGGITPDNNMDAVISSVENSDNAIIVQSDSQVEAAVLYQNGAIGYVASMHGSDYTTSETMVQAAGVLVGDTHVSLNTASLQACLEEDSAFFREGSRLHTFDVDAIEDPNCWPFALSFDVAIDANDVEKQCEEGGRSDALSFVAWLYDSSTDVRQPLESLGVVPVSNKMRDAFHTSIIQECNPPYDDPIPTVVIVVCVILGIMFILTFFFVLYLRKKLINERKVIEDLQLTMRYVALNWTPSRKAVVEMPLPTLSASLGSHKVTWYWQEDEGRMDEHILSMTMQPHWVKYEDQISADLETHYIKFGNKKGPVHTTITCGPGNEYTINFAEMHQTNKKTNYRRRILRVPPTGNIDEDDIEQGHNGSTHSSLDDLPTELHKEEPFLELRVGSIIQTMKTMKTSSGDTWSYGTVIVEPEGSPGTDTSVSVAVPSTTTTIQLHDGKVAEVSKETGWFPHTMTEEPDRKALERLVKRDGESFQVPSHWEDVKDPLVAERFLLPSTGEEYQAVAKQFQSTMNKETMIHSIERIQNVAMYRSYSVKRHTLLQREMGSDHKADRFERVLYHGTNEDVIPKIVQQGFNRSFCGKNATRFGKGVYFAADAAYSASSIYAVPNDFGQCFMFLARVTIGEYCLGRLDALTPDTRDQKTCQLYDSTVDNIQKPRIFVTYHDAQAYPEYLVCFSKC